MGILRDCKMHLASLDGVCFTASTVMKISDLSFPDFQIMGNGRCNRPWTS